MSLNQDQITAPLTPIARQDVRIIVSTKFRFQRTILRMFGPTRLAAINASVDPFILLSICPIQRNVAFEEARMISGL